MKKYLPVVSLLVLIKFVIHWFGNQNYGFHRDELLHLSVSEHFDWGYYEFPPFIAWAGQFAHWLFDYSLWGVRLFPTLAGIGIMFLVIWMALSLGGRQYSVLLAGVCVLAFLPFYRNHTLFQPVAFDQFFWTFGFFSLVQFISTANKKYLYWAGIAVGFGLLNKYTMLVWLLGTLIGLLFYRKGQLYTNKHFYFSALLAFLLFLPNIIWQIQHELPVLDHLQALKTHQLEKANPWTFGLEQLYSPFTLALSLIGLLALFIDQDLKKYKSIGIAVSVIFLSLWVVQAKAYYVFGIYPVLFATGAVKIEKWLSNRPWAVYATAAVMILPAIPFIPDATPVLPIETFVAYADIEQEDGRYQLTGDYADMFGWDEQVKLVDSLYQKLDESEKRNCVIWAENYGEAGALKVLGKKYQLPNPVSRHGSFWQWGHGNSDATVWISVGNEKESVEHVFEDTQLVKIIRHPYAIDEEHEIPVYLCRKPKVDIPDWWAAYEPYIFN